MHTDVVDQLFRNQGLPFVRAIEQFSHGDWRRAILTNLPEVSQIFRRERIFKEEHTELFRLFTELHRFVWRQALMHIMEQFNFIAKFATADLSSFNARRIWAAGSKSGLSWRAFGLLF